jgi:PAS domain S-box-containing protein
MITVNGMTTSTKILDRSLAEKFSRHYVTVPIVAGIIMAAFAILVWQLIEADQVRRLNAGTRGNTERFTSQLEAHVATRLDVGNYLKREWSEGAINSKSDFERETLSAQKLFDDFQAINWIDNNGIVRWVTPEAGNEAAVGLDIRKLSVPGLILSEAERTERMHVTPPITLAQGGAGFVAYLPLIRNKTKEGTLNIVFRTRTLIEGAFREGIGDDYHLSVSDGNLTIFIDEKTDIKDLSELTFRKYQVQKSINIGNRKWAVSVSPTQKYLERVASPVDEIVLVVGLLLALITTYLIHLVLLRQLSLRESEERFRDFVNASSDWLWETDSELRFTYFSDQFEQVSGVSPDQLLMKTRQESPIPGMEPHVWKAHLEDLNNRRAFHDFVVPRTQADGRVVWLSTNGAPVFDDDGNFAGYRGTGSDVTERKTTEIQLLRNQHQLSTAVEFARIGYWEWDEKLDCATYYTEDMFEILDIDPAEFDDGKLDGVIDRQHVHPDDLERYTYIVGFSGGKEDRYDIKHRSVRRNGEIRYSREIGEAIRDETGAIVRSYGTVQDITDFVLKEKALEQALDDAERAARSKSEFLATMSHEFRTPLNAILGFSEMIGTQVFGPLGSEKYDEYLDDIRVSGKHMLALVNDVLDLSAIEAGKQAISTEPIPLVKFLEDCIRNLEPVVNAAEITLSINVPDNSLTLLADKRSIYQIMLNLLSNAIKFTEPNGKIVVSANKMDETVIIEVRDTGVGIPADRLSSVTDPFSQSHTDPHRTQEGTGLGLSIVASLVKAHGGTLVIESEIDRGTSVKVSFPTQGGAEE